MEISRRLFTVKEDNRRRAKVDRLRGWRVVYSIGRSMPSEGRAQLCERIFCQRVKFSRGCNSTRRSTWAGIRWTRFRLALLANCSPRTGVGRKLFGADGVLLDIPLFSRSSRFLRLLDAFLRLIALF